MSDRHVITSLGGPDGQVLWISDNAEEVLGRAAERIPEHGLTIPAFLGGLTYDQVFAEERQKIGPRLSFRSWLVKFQNSGESEPIGVAALFLRGGDGQIETVVGAAWPCLEYCPVCSQMFPGSIALRRAVLGLARALAASL